VNDEATRKFTLRNWLASGAPWIWITAAGVGINILMVAGLVGLIAFRGLAHFWPADVVQFSLSGQARTVLGEIKDEERIPAQQMRESGVNVAAGTEWVKRDLVKVGNRDVSGHDFRWVLEQEVTTRNKPRDVVVIERREWGNFYGFLREIHENHRVVADAGRVWAALPLRLQRALDLQARIHHIEKRDIGLINYQLERLRLQQRKLELQHRLTETVRQSIAEQSQALNARFKDLQKKATALKAQSSRDSVVAETATGQRVEISMSKIVRVFRPNAMSVVGKARHYVAKLWEFIAEEPREANTEGGIFPAIYGTVLMVLLMSAMVTPFGILAAVYMHEYASQGFIIRGIRVAVNNLAGVPSIVYGVFGLGFFIYGIGAHVDRWFFPEALPAPTFGTGGLLWASLTLALLTLPVVIVATEEGLSRVPKFIREGSLALGATQAETLWRSVLPMASPAIMTGIILAVARAAGEVAPLMLVGVVKLAPALPVDLNFPFFHPERKFMHMGFHIFDLGFQSPNVEATQPLVYATALLLVLVIIALNLTAISIRNRLRERYKTLDH